MGLLSLEYNQNDFPQFARISASLPTMSNQILGYVGNQSKKILKQEILSGQLLDYHGNWKDKRGRSKATYGIKYAQYVTVRSYPSNFFSKTNARQKKRDIWGSLKNKTNAKLQMILNEYDKKYLEPQFKKFAENPGSRDRF